MPPAPATVLQQPLPAPPPFRPPRVARPSPLPRPRLMPAALLPALKAGGTSSLAHAQPGLAPAQRASRPAVLPPQMLMPPHPPSVAMEALRPQMLMPVRPAGAAVRLPALMPLRSARVATAAALQVPLPGPPHPARSEAGRAELCMLGSRVACAGSLAAPHWLLTPLLAPRASHAPFL